MEKIDFYIKNTYYILSLLNKKHRFLNEKDVKIGVNNFINNSRTQLKKGVSNFNSDKVDLEFQNSINFLIKYKLIDFNIEKGVRFFKISKVGAVLVKKLEEEKCI